MFRSIRMPTVPNRGTVPVLTTITILLLCFSAAGICQEVSSVSIPSNSLRLQEGEGAGGFEVDISGGQIISFPNVPEGWGIFIENEPNQTARIGGNAAVGSAFLEPGFFDDFILIALRHADPESLKIKITIGTMTNVTLKERWLDLNKDDLVLKKVK